MNKEYLIYFTADTHFNHSAIIQYANRPFKDRDHMNEELIKRWNSVVKKGGLVYHLGDFAWGSDRGYQTSGIREILDCLNGQIFLIQGSHDKPMLKIFKEGCSKIVKVSPLEKISIEGIDVTLCHYCMKVWPRSHFNSWHLFGHSHARLEPVGKSLDVGVDGHAFYPWTWYEIKRYMKDRPNNFNVVETFSGRGL